MRHFDPCQGPHCLRRHGGSYSSREAPIFLRDWSLSTGEGGGGVATILKRGGVKGFSHPEGGGGAQQVLMP